jgi:prepilin-type N-terminal cleavage/methylation domain-containing protein
MKLHFSSLLAASKLRRGITPQSTSNALAKGRKTGFTLLEILAVVGVMAILVAGGIAIYNWVTVAALERKNAEIMYDIQRQMRMYAAAKNLKIGDELEKEDLVGEGKPFESLPKAPGGVDYNWRSTVPARGTPYVTHPDPKIQSKIDTTNW